MNSLEQSIEVKSNSILTLLASKISKSVEINRILGLVKEEENLIQPPTRFSDLTWKFSTFIAMTHPFYLSHRYQSRAQVCFKFIFTTRGARGWTEYILELPWWGKFNSAWLPSAHIHMTSFLGQSEHNDSVGIVFPQIIKICWWQFWDILKQKAL